MDSIHPTQNLSEGIRIGGRRLLFSSLIEQAEEGQVRAARMSLLNQNGYLTLPALFLASTLGCATDDSWDEQEVTAPTLGDLEANAVPPELGGEFLLSFVVNLFPDAEIRFIATVDFTPAGDGGGTANFSFQPINAPECVPDGGGLPVAVAPLVATGVPIDPDGAFAIEVVGATLPADANAVLCSDLGGDIGVTGTVQSADFLCGDIATVLPGTFGAIRIEPGTVGDENLPAPVTSCP